MGGEHAAGGVGLGLAICREITEAHKGWIGLRDNEGTGSIFMVALPAAEVPERAADSATDEWEEQAIGA